MAKISIEFCIISARGLGHKSSILKPQWFAVGWIDPNLKYCTKIDASGNQDPSWGTKFCFSVDENDANLNGMSLTIEVYRREPIFLREHLQGTALVHMKEYLAKFLHAMDNSGIVHETASFQLRKKSGKAQGLVDISIRICKDEIFSACSGPQEEGTYPDRQKGITLAIEDGPVYTFPPAASNKTKGIRQAPAPYKNTMPAPVIHPDPPISNTGHFQQIIQPPPPSNHGVPPPAYSGPGRLPNSYINLPSSSSSNRPAFGIGLGAGAIAAGAMIFGDDFLSGSNFQSSFDSASLTVSTDPPF